MSNPYRNLADHQFWRRSVAGVERFRFDPVVETRFKIAQADKVATAGSCFAQHISNRLSRIGFNYLVTERGEELSAQERVARNYGVYSARYGNLYTSRQLLQLFQLAFGERQVGQEAWQRDDGRFVDPLRPQIEPAGFESPGAVLHERERHLAAVREMFETCDVFVFTLGLTEAWRRRSDGTVYPLAPGVAGGSFDPGVHEFVNLDVHDVLGDMQAFMQAFRGINPRSRVLLTVSPVPLIATYVNRNVLVSTTYSKSVLRVVAEMIRRDHEGVEYFPSYEIITGNYTDSTYYEADYRSVNALGVDHAMRCFLDNFTARATKAPASSAGRVAAPDADLVCDEEAIDQTNI